MHISHDPDQRDSAQNGTIGAAVVRKQPLQSQPLTLLLAAIVLVILAGSGGYLLHGNTAAASGTQPVPTFVPVPANSALVRTENILTSGTHNWYFTVPQLTEDAGVALYRAQLAHQGWRCFTVMTSTNMTYYGQPMTGTSVYMTAIRGATLAQIYLGDQDYGAFLVGDDVPANAIGLKLSLEPAKKTTC